MLKKLERSGFTIVELLVALVVGGIMFVSLNAMYTSQTYLAQRSRDVVLANAFVESKVESLRSKGFLSLSNGTTDITNELPDELSSSRSGTLVIGTYSDGVKSIEITVTYNEQGSSRSYYYKTFIGELGVGQY